MKNRILVLTRDTIPYVKWLRPIAGSVTACIVMQQLDYWFEKEPDGYFKFLEPCENNSAYRKGDSWEEELGVTADEFRTAFDKIGVRYRSKREFDAALDKFQGRYYCAYHDKMKGLTFYFRNHDLLDAELDRLARAQDTSHLRNRQTPVTGEKAMPRNRQMPDTEDGNPNLRNSQTPVTYLANSSPNLQETTQEITQKNTATSAHLETKADAHPEADVVCSSLNKSSVPIRPVKNSRGIATMPLSPHGMTTVGDLMPDPAKIAPQSAPVAPVAADPDIVQALIQAGVDPPQAPQLALCSDRETILGQIDAWRAGAFGEGVGALVQAIRRHWKADGQAKAKADDAAKARREAIQSRSLQNREDRERLEREGRLQAWRALPDPQRAEIERQARARLSTSHLMRGKEERGPIFQALLAGSIAFVMEQHENGAETGMIPGIG